MQKKKKDNAPIDPVILATIASKESRGGRKLQERDKKKGLSREGDQKQGIRTGGRRHTGARM